MDGDINNKTGKAAVLIENVVGCGRFQVIATLCVFLLGNSASVFTMLFMAFGNYNPGWRCRDLTVSNDSTILTNDSNISFVNGLNSSHGDANDTVLLYEEKRFEYQKEDNCPLFESCKNIEFDPESSTIVSEWGLLCDKQWIPTIIISVQMAGVFAGSLVAGHLGDAYGRKPVLYGAVLAIACLNIISIFSVSWQMFAAIRFILGINSALVICFYYVFSSEFVPQKYRSVLQGIPGWNISGAFLALTCMGLKDWRHVHIVTSILGFVGFIPKVWIPESLRWLEVKSKTEDFLLAAKKIASANGKPLPSLETLQKMADSSNKRSEVITKKKTYNVSHIFKKGYAKYTILLTIPWISTAAVAYALRFGIKALYGNFYINLLASFLFGVPFCVFPITLPNLLGRKKAALVFSGLIVGCMLGAAMFEFFGESGSEQRIGTTVLVFVTKVCIDGMWSSVVLFTMELYPTVIRGIAMSWGIFVARVGSILSPFLSPSQAHGGSVAYTILAAMIFIPFCIFFALPETKGMPLKDTIGKSGDEKYNGDSGEANDNHDDVDENVDAMSLSNNDGFRCATGGGDDNKC